MHISFRLEVQRDKQNCVDTVNKNWLPWQRPLRDQKITSGRLSTANRLHKFIEDRSGKR